MSGADAAVTERFGAFDFGLTADQEERARRLHAESIVIDMLFQGPCGYRSFAGLQLPEPTGDLQRDWHAVMEVPVRAALGGGYEELHDAWRGSGITAANRQAGFEPHDVDAFALAQAQFDGLPWLVKAVTADDIRRAKTDGTIAGYISTQDTEGIDRKLAGLQRAYDFGMRMVGLTYNMQNSVGCGCTERRDSGVSQLGAKLIARMDELGMIVDTSHSGAQTTLDACGLSERPVVASHTSAAALYDVARAKSDEELQAIAETGGVIGVYTIPFFLASGAGVTIEAMLDHIDYLCELVGWRHVGIGTDWPLQMDRETLRDIFLPLTTNGLGFRDEHAVGIANLVGFDDYRDFPNVVRGLVGRGYDDEQIRGILGENFLRVFEAVCG